MRRTNEWNASTAKSPQPTLVPNAITAATRDPFDAVEKCMKFIVSIR